MKKSLVILWLKGRMSYALGTVFLLLSATVFVFPIESAAYPNGLVSYWQFNEGSGNTVTDSVGTNGGTIDGAVWDGGLVNGALRFDGINDIVRLPAISGYGDFTMSAWFKKTSSTPDGAVFQTGMGYIIKTDPAGNYLGCWAQYLIFADRQGGGGTQYAFEYNPSSNVISEDSWHFAVMTGTADNSEMKAYLDGVHIGNLTYTFSGWNSTLDYTNIGALKASLYPGNNEGCYFSGSIDEVASFNRALPADEINLYYQTGLNGQDLSIFGPGGGGGGGGTNPVPEPATMLLLGSGLVWLVGFRRKFRKGQSLSKRSTI